MKKLLTILVLIMLIISFFQITSMYALYKEEIDGDYSSLLGIWTIKVNGKDVTSSGQVETFTIDKLTQLGYISSDYIQAGKIAPSGQAYFDIVIDPSTIYKDAEDTEHTVYNDVSIIYELNMESTDIPNVQIDLIEVDNYFKKDGATDIENTQVNQNGNLYTAVIPIEKIIAGYKNHLRLTLQWTNLETNNTTDSQLAMYEATNQNITWTSSDETVATVANGIVTGIAEGTSTITVTTADGSFTDTCIVTVSGEAVAEEDKISAEKTVLDKTQLTLKQSQTETLLVDVLPNAATDKNVVWASDNEEVATVVNGVVTGLSAGTAKITVKTSNNNDIDTCTVTVTENTISPTISVKGVELDKSTLTLKPGETGVLKQYVESNSAVISVPIEINLKQYTGEVIGNGS